MTATSGKRLAAFGWDYAIVAVYMASLVAMSVAVQGVPGEFVVPSSPLLFDLFVFIVLVLPVILYFAFSETSRTGATWGKRHMGLRVVAVEGGRLTLRRGLIRSALKFLPWQIAHTCLFHIPGWPAAPMAPPSWVSAGFVMVLALVLTYMWGLFFATGHRTLYDIAARSKVLISSRS